MDWNAKLRTTSGTMNIHQHSSPLSYHKYREIHYNIVTSRQYRYDTNDVCRFSRDPVVECSERTVLSCVEPVCLCWRRFGRCFSHHLAQDTTELFFQNILQQYRYDLLKNVKRYDSLTIICHYSVCVKLVDLLNY